MRTETLEVTWFYYDNGQLLSESYLLKNGTCHNPNGPAFRRWHENGQLHIETYWVNGDLHNPNGLAHRRYNKDGQLEYEEYWIDNIHLTKEEFENRTKTCDGKVVVIDGNKYKLKEVGN